MYKFYKWRLLHPTADGGAASADKEGAGGVPAEGEGAGAEGELNGADGQEGEGGKDTGDAVSMTKAEYEAELEKAERRGERRARGKAAAPASDGEGGDAPSEADLKLRAANERMLAATIKDVGSDLEISGNGMKVAAKMINLGDCFDEAGDVDETAVRDGLEAFLADFPEFKKVAERKPAFQAQGNPKGGAFAKMSKEEIMKIKDPAKRRDAIAENITLFQ